jgi:hypothetical protein
MATPAKPPEGDAEKMAGPWSRISAETIQVDENLGCDPLLVDDYL